MRKLRRSECAVLTLVLKRKWYEMIERGEKREEYRDAKPYWRKRIFRWYYKQADHYVVTFSCGYRKPDMAFVACCSILTTYMGYEHPEWGEPKEPHYKILLGERVELED